MKSSRISDYKINVKNYKVVKELNRGGFGIVYKIKNRSTNQIYAAKVLLSGNSESMKQMIDREVNIMIRIDHPTVIRFHGFSLTDFSNNKNVTIIMDFADKGSLADILDLIDKGLTPKGYDNTTRQIILIGISYGMMHIHNCKAIHRDLKPGNILIDKNFHPHISDFGLSKFTKAGHSKDMSRFGGTPEYMAPEIISSKPYNEKVDVYAFGIIMFQVVTDCMPYPLFESGKMALYQFHQKVVEQKYRPSFEDCFPVNPALKELIQQCWSAKPEDRPSFEEIFNRLAYNQQFSIFGAYTSEEFEDNEADNNYYLSDVNLDEVFDYINEITKSKEKRYIDELEKKISKNEKIISEQGQQIKELKDQILQIIKQNQEQSEQIHNLNEQIKKQKESSLVKDNKHSDEDISTNVL